MTEEQPPKSGWTEAGLDAVVSWFPALPKSVKVIFASATIYLILCLVAQIPPQTLPAAVGAAIGDWLQSTRQRTEADRSEVAKERADVIQLLMDERAELRAQADAMRATPNSDARVDALEQRMRVVETQLHALLDAHPKVPR